jgi:hypothetical protein
MLGFRPFVCSLFLFNLLRSVLFELRVPRGNSVVVEPGPAFSSRWVASSAVEWVISLVRVNYRLPRKLGPVV